MNERLIGSLFVIALGHLEDESHNRPGQSMPLNIIYSTNISDKNSPVTNCLSPSSLLASQFSQSIGFSPTSSSFDDFNNRLVRHVFLPTNILHSPTLTNSTVTMSTGTPVTATSSTTTTTTVPLVSPISSSSNLLLSFASNANRFEIFPQQRRDQQSMVDTSTTSSTTNAATPTTHVLCR